MSEDRVTRLAYAGIVGALCALNWTSWVGLIATVGLILLANVIGWAFGKDSP